MERHDSRVLSMRGLVPPDPETDVSQAHYAVVYVPRRSRSRFPAGSVELMTSAQDALNHADRNAKRYPARVIGPSKSSEGQSVYYLLEWLKKGPSNNLAPPTKPES